jgi:hypothetical protein
MAWRPAAHPYPATPSPGRKALICPAPPSICLWPISTIFATEAEIDEARAAAERLAEERG